VSLLTLAKKMKTYQLAEVFNESEIPVLTFIPPKEFNDIVGSILTSGKHITLSGPSGCGKTTLAKKALEKAKFNPGKSHWISGRDYSHCTTVEEVFSKEFGCSDDTKEILQYLELSGLLVIDDFHHLKDEVRQVIASKMKRWNELSIRLFLIGIASSNKKIVDEDSELGIRNDYYEMKQQDDEFCRQIIVEGESYLKIKFDETTRTEFIAASDMIPSAIQVICRVACIRNDILETQESEKAISCKIQSIKDGVLRIYKGKYHNKLIGLCKGKQQARSVHHTYFDIIKHLSLIGKGEVGIKEIQTRVLRDYTDPKEKAKKTTSFHNCIKYLPEVIEERGLEDSIYVSSSSDTISIEDPSFGLYLSLIDIDEIGQSIKMRRSGYPWDVAVSFAGEDRSIVEEFKNILNKSGYTVFYDFDVQHQLWGADLRKKLSDVYSNEAEYMLIFLSKHYPEKDWTNFEFEIGKEARGKRTSEYLLPVKIDDVSVVGLSQNVGHIDLRRCSVEDLAKSAMNKIEKS
jgi:energy-coupling factor transporter ATP-binding protein EcfA2